MLKPLLTQVETKVKPLFFTKTLSRYTTVKFTVTGIGQVTVTTVKYEKEYVTRCYNKGYHRRDFQEDGPEVRESGIGINPDRPRAPLYSVGLTSIPPPPGIPYDVPLYYSGSNVEPVKKLPDSKVSRKPPTSKKEPPLYEMDTYKKPFPKPIVQGEDYKRRVLNRRTQNKSSSFGFKNDPILSPSKRLVNQETSLPHPPLRRPYKTRHRSKREENENNIEIKSKTSMQNTVDLESEDLLNALKLESLSPKIAVLQGSFN